MVVIKSSGMARADPCKVVNVEFVVIVMLRNSYAKSVPAVQTFIYGPDLAGETCESWRNRLHWNKTDHQHTK